MLEPGRIFSLYKHFALYPVPFLSRPTPSLKKLMLFSRNNYNKINQFINIVFCEWEDDTKIEIFYHPAAPVICIDKNTKDREFFRFFGFLALIKKESGKFSEEKIRNSEFCPYIRDINIIKEEIFDERIENFLNSFGRNLIFFIFNAIRDKYFTTEYIAQILDIDFEELRSLYEDLLVYAYLDRLENEKKYIYFTKNLEKNK